MEQTWTKAEDGLGRRGIARGEQWAQSSLSQVSGEGARLGGRCDVSGVLGDVSNLTLGATRTVPIKQPKLDSTAGATKQRRCTDDNKFSGSAESARVSADPSADSGTDPGLKDWYTRCATVLWLPNGLSKKLFISITPAHATTGLHKYASFGHHLAKQNTVIVSQSLEDWAF